MFRNNLTKPLQVTFFTPTAFRRFAANQVQIAPVPIGRLSPKEKTTRRKDIQETLTKWKLKVGFEFHAQI